MGFSAIGVLILTVAVNIIYIMMDVWTSLKKWNKDIQMAKEKHRAKEAKKRAEEEEANKKRELAANEEVKNDEEKPKEEEPKEEEPIPMTDMTFGQKEEAKKKSKKKGKKKGKKGLKKIKPKEETKEETLVEKVRKEYIRQNDEFNNRELPKPIVLNTLQN